MLSLRIYLLSTTAVHSAAAWEGEGSSFSSPSADSKEGEEQAEDWEGKVGSLLLSTTWIYGGFKWLCDHVPAVGCKACEGTWGDRRWSGWHIRDIPGCCCTDLTLPSQQLQRDCHGVIPVAQTCQTGGEVRKRPRSCGVSPVPRLAHAALSKLC